MTAWAMSAWLVPTVRSTAWHALAAVTLALAVVSALAANTGRWPLGLLGITAGCVAAAVVSGLRDRAAPLLSALPTSAAVQRARRLALLTVVGLGVWTAYLWSGQPLVPGLGWPIGPVVALIASGATLAVWAPRGGVAVGVAVPLGWTAAAQASVGLDNDFSDVVFAWQHHPWILTVAAVAALVMGRER
jgi:hypothetical protein